MASSSSFRTAPNPYAVPEWVLLELSVRIDQGPGNSTHVKYLNYLLETASRVPATPNYFVIMAKTVHIKPAYGSTAEVLVLFKLDEDKKEITFCNEIRMKFYSYETGYFFPIADSNVIVWITDNVGNIALLVCDNGYLQMYSYLKQLSNHRAITDILIHPESRELFFASASEKDTEIYLHRIDAFTQRPLSLFQIIDASEAKDIINSLTNMADSKSPGSPSLMSIYHDEIEIQWAWETVQDKVTIPYSLKSYPLNQPITNSNPSIEKILMELSEFAKMIPHDIVRLIAVYVPSRTRYFSPNLYYELTQKGIFSAKEKTSKKISEKEAKPVSIECKEFIGLDKNQKAIEKLSSKLKKLKEKFEITDSYRLPKTTHSALLELIREDVESFFFKDDDEIKGFIELKMEKALPSVGIYNIFSSSLIKTIHQLPQNSKEYQLASHIVKLLHFEGVHVSAEVHGANKIYQEMIFIIKNSSPGECWKNLHAACTGSGVIIKTLKNYKNVGFIFSPIFKEIEKIANQLNEKNESQFFYKK